MNASGVVGQLTVAPCGLTRTRPRDLPRAITLDAGGIPLSALLVEPRPGPPRAVVVAVHGGGMRAGYFDSQVRPGLSLLALGARLGYTVLAVDRPGYGSSAAVLPRGQTLTEQAVTLLDGLEAFADRYDTGAGMFLVAHSNGGKLALAAAAETRGRALLGLDISGLGSRLAVGPDQLPGQNGHGDWRRHWGSLRLYPPDAFRQGRHLVSPVPELEAYEGPSWPRRYPAIAREVRVPVRFTFAEQEQWWLFDDDAVAALREPLAAPTVVVDHQPDAGHNISLGWAARAYHLKALGFLEDLLLAEDAAPAGRPTEPIGDDTPPKDRQR
ncbi:pimeloyl-ACP methyl ester carboxylesterase [Streptomyces sp. SAI-144]|uniref:alpha/beta hydrolase n=1 Tax=unclassified Streptomyces TaxID=2593676 RepID=UPI002474F675|nr:MULTISPECIES: alpha/beta hydrolase [unclassified Streptomyces]MDH6435201.1 pimeloyl-ACP methyl ester carboxylesterase [Streptomyces sp. SAI-144]MDH6489347.1 pimeloyl-ACP methyl ester carboxylesterase [Streptomyces sp. SAI-127]